MFLVISLISQIVFALTCACGEYSDYYSAYSYCQPSYYEYQQYTPYYYDYSSYSQPAYDNPSIIAYPYPVPVIYEKEVETCPCKCKCSCRDSEYEPRRRGNSDDYCSSKCTRTSTECERIYTEHRDTSPRCQCDNSDRRVDRECPCKKIKNSRPKYESDEGNTRRCICFCEDLRYSDYRGSRRDDREYRHRESDCGCGCKSIF